MKTIHLNLAAKPYRNYRPVWIVVAGATLATMRKYYGVLIADAVRDGHVQSVWSVGWVYYYLTRPLLGSVLGGLSNLFEK